ncbi:YHS domain-containing (seleno)protein [Spongiivirga sp. MCCC 1A20706]|uniref:YHS domain-containing (seleno)protein n=1 Tax=Spongiivirga sp. MCCC 1A20706 TaxID=3160963 RepID=UPI003977A49B
MKKILGVLFFLIAFVSNAQSIDYYTKKGFAVEGYDVVSYFDGTPKKGSKSITSEHDGVKFSFSSKANLERFKADPEKYIPEYGGYCAYAVAVKGKKVKIDPETYEIRDDKLYLFYNAWGTNTLELWTKEGAEKLKTDADKKWEKIKKRKS